MFGLKVNHTALFGFIQNPTDWSNTIFILLFGSVLSGIILAGAFVGSLIFGKTDLMVFATVTTTLLTFCIPITSLWQLIYEEIGLWGSNAVGIYMASLITAPLLILAVFTIINWWRGNSEL
jgi:hypothetical protein